MKKGKKKKKTGGIVRGILDTGVFILTVLIIAFVMSRYVVRRVKVHNHSMEHTLEEGDSVIIDKLTYRFRDPERYEIIVFKQKGTGEDLIKRVIGLPFETVQIVEGEFYIDGEKIEDVEELDKPEYAGLAENSVELSVGEYFVVGDNRKESIDSRYDEVGVVTSTRITGRMLFKLGRLNNDN